MPGTSSWLSIRHPLLLVVDLPDMQRFRVLSEAGLFRPRRQCNHSSTSTSACPASYLTSIFVSSPSASSPKNS